MTDFTIRLETEKDYREVEELTREAFWNVYKPGADEHYFVHKMRKHPDFISELAFVLEKDGRIIGNIMYTKAWLQDKNGERKEILSINISNKAEGSFVLGVGTVKNKEYYIAYEVLKDNGKKLVKIPIDNSVIYDILEDEENAYIEIVTNGLRQEVETKIYVPKGTITKEYDMSLE